MSMGVITESTVMTELAVRLDHVAKSYSYSLEDINLDIPYGEIMGFIGRNGAGKSTTTRIILGLVRREEGSVNVLGH